jgi:hypothetical protein
MDEYESSYAGSVASSCSEAGDVEEVQLDNEKATPVFSGLQEAPGSGPLPSETRYVGDFFSRVADSKVCCMLCNLSMRMKSAHRHLKLKHPVQYSTLTNQQEKERNRARPLVRWWFQNHEEVWSFFEKSPESRAQSNIATCKMCGDVIRSGITQYSFWKHVHDRHLVQYDSVCEQLRNACKINLE